MAGLMKPDGAALCAVATAAFLLTVPSAGAHRSRGDHRLGLRRRPGMPSHQPL